jgi:translation elongation factor EF-G
MSEFYDRNLELICKFSAEWERGIEKELLKTHLTEKELLGTDEAENERYKNLVVQHALNNCNILFEEMSGGWANKATTILNASATGVLDLDIANKLLSKIEDRICVKEMWEMIEKRIVELEQKTSKLNSKMYSM